MSLRPFLARVATLVPPPHVSFGAPVSHVGQRALQRGVVSVPGDVLAWAISEAQGRGWSDCIEFVFDICPESAVYRILLPEGPFYPVIRCGDQLRTIFTQDQIRAMRRVRRLTKRRAGRRVRRDVSQ